MESIDIRDLRSRLGDISQAELGQRLGGLSQSAVSRMESGESPIPGPVAILLRQLDESIRSKGRRPPQTSPQGAAA